MTGIEAASSGPHWVINLGAPARSPMSDPRLVGVREAMIELQPQLVAIDVTMHKVEALLRECAEKGMTKDEIAVQASLAIEAVTRVLDGGSLLGWNRG